MKTILHLSHEQVLWGALAVWQEKEGELATMSLEFEFHLQSPFGSPSESCQISTNQRKVEMGVNLNVPRVMT